MSFRVLLSYARDDASIAAWLRTRAGAYRTPRSLVGTRGILGPVPQRIKLATARDFKQTDFEDPPQALVVVCSPAAASDAGVNADIDAFLSQGRARRVVAVIVPNAPAAGDVQRDFFPPAISGRGVFTTDLRERRVGDTLEGDGREGGWLKLAAQLLGIDMTRLTEHEGRRHNTRVALTTAIAALCAFAAIGAAAYGFRTQRHAANVETQRQNAALNAMHSLQVGREAVAAAQQQAAAQATAARDFDRAKASLLITVRDVGASSGQVMDAIEADGAASPSNLRNLSSVERVYWDLADIAPYFEIAPTALTGALTRISGLYQKLGHGDDAKRVDARFSQLTDRVARNRSVSPGWRTTYAAAVVAMANRIDGDDDPGKQSALQQAGRIYEDVCLTTPSHQFQSPAVETIRTNDCLRFAALVLARASQNLKAQQPVDAAALHRADLVLEAALAAYPNTAAIQSRAPAMRAQIAQALQPPSPSTTRVRD